jgi:hypothetical protein
VNDVVIVEATKYMQNGIGISDVSQELVSQSIAFACAFHQARDIHDFDGGWY